jgi:hypothetical protein
MRFALAGSAKVQRCESEKVRRYPVRCRAVRKCKGVKVRKSVVFPSILYFIFYCKSGRIIFRIVCVFYKRR